MKRKLPFVVILLLAFALRVYHLASLSIWLDESFSIAAARLPVGELLQFIAARSHPPLYFLLLRAWMSLGDGEFVVRFLSVIWGVIGVAALYLFGRRVLGERAGLLAALLLAVSPIHVWHSQDARMYTMLFALTTLSSYFLIQVLSRHRASDWLGYTLFTALSLYTHNTVLFTITAQALFAGVYIVRRREWSLLWKGGLAVALIGILYLPWLPAAMNQTTHLRQYFWPTPPNGLSVLKTFDYLSSAFLFRDSPWFSNLEEWPGSLLYLIYLGLFLLGSWQLIRRRTMWAPLLFLLLVTPIAGEFIASQVRPIYLNRTLLVVAAPLFIIYAASVTAGRGVGRKAAIVLLIAGLGLNLFSLANMYTNALKEEWRQAASLVAEGAEPGDVLFFDQGMVQIPFDYYYQQHEFTIDEYGYPREHTYWRSQQNLDRDQWWVVDYINTDPEAALSRLTHIANQRRVVWLVTNRSMSEGRLEAWLAENSAQFQVHNFPWITVHRFELEAQD